MNHLQLRDYKKAIFSIKSELEFNALALKAFHYQYSHVPVYSQFCDYLGRRDPKNYKEIPFLPISFFKTHQVKDNCETQKVFMSSGTTGMTRSKHHVVDLELYKASFTLCFQHFFGDPRDYVILGLLPNYIEQGDSSLVYMVEALIQLSENPKSGFYLSNHDALLSTLGVCQKDGDKKIVLFGVAYALLDLAELNGDFSKVKIIETGGMKGRRKELLKEELHGLLKRGLVGAPIFSEYGMTELLSQAYATENQRFLCPPWMQILIRDINDPMEWLPNGKTGGINVIDLANIHSCCFIATDDLGSRDQESFEIRGRLDLSDIRGCNLLVN
jgi:phenylacetate-coenzyme A ligase PaaK-like adenylate-forming protein